MWIAQALTIAGIGAIVYGAWQLNPVLPWFIGGLLAIWFAYDFQRHLGVKDDRKSAAGSSD